MSEITISAVIPAYNAEESIRDAVASMLGQSLAPLEVIVVDDGSGDATVEVATAAGARVIRQENRGPAAARNAGIRAAKSPWIALLDADDRARPNRLARQALAAGQEGVDVVFADHRVEGRATPAAREPLVIDFEQLWRRNCVPTSTVLLAKAAWERAGGFDEARDLIGVEDYNLWLRLARAGARFQHVNEVLVDYCPTATSLTAQTRRFAAAEIENVRRVSQQLGLDQDAITRKEHAVYLEYGLELFFVRDYSVSGRFLREAAHRGSIGLGVHLRRLACSLPVWLLPR